MGTIEEAANFRRRMKSPHVFLSDPEQKLYKAFGLVRAKTNQIVNANVFLRGFSATIQGHGVGRPVGDPMQMPGAFKIEPDGAISWSHQSVDVADNLTEEDLQSVLRGSS